MEYIASLSYGKDSLYMLEVIKENNLPLDRIVHVEIMATETIHADVPEMVAFKKHADRIILQKYGITVEHISAEKTYEDWFYHVRGVRAKPENRGKIYGFPMVKGAWCNSRLKMSVLGRFDKEGIVQYIGIAAEETKRHKILTERKRSPLAEYGITEKQCRDWCEENDLLSPIYNTGTRGGCWFCHNQRIEQLRILRKKYPEYWQKMLEWDKDSPVSFKPNGKTVHDFERRFTLEEQQITLFDASYQHINNNNVEK